jgi:hypothetical protein
MKFGKLVSLVVATVTFIGSVIGTSFAESSLNVTSSDNVTVFH